MRISDWSSDVCSSDLQATIRQTFAEAVPELQALYKKQREEGIELIKSSGAKVRVLSDEEKATLRERAFEPTKEVYLDRHRSEEHTSELQSLMRISYAVFCLKKKKKKDKTNKNINQKT